MITRAPYLNAVIVVTWDNIAPRLLPATTTYTYPADVRLELWTDDDRVTVLCHSIPNIGQFPWVARLPRAWSNDYWCVDIDSDS